MVEVLPGKLALVPKGDDKLGWPSDTLLEFSQIPAPEFRAAKYEVCHYSKQATNAAIGPLSFDQTLRYAYEVRARLSKDGAKLQCVYEPGQRENVAVLLGAYLILCEGFDADRLVSVLRSEASRKFPCSWIQQSELRTEKGAPFMSVEDCWRGLHMAKRMGWIDADALLDEAKITSAASNFWRTLMETDGAWLIPGKVFVMADPITVIKDPNPLTTSQLTPEEGDAPREASETTLVAQQVMERLFATKKVDPAWPKPTDFISFCKRGNIKAIVRTNGSNEPGLQSLGGSYKPSSFTSNGIQHAECYLDDVKGAVPGASLIKKFLSEAARMGFSEEDGAAPGKAIAIHCKSGFGRSILFACLLIIYLWDVPGRALMGWVRIARPGAVVTPEQERFFASLGGKEDLLKKVEGGAGGGGGCCVVA